MGSSDVHRLEPAAPARTTPRYLPRSSRTTYFRVPRTRTSHEHHVAAAPGPPPRRWVRHPTSESPEDHLRPGPRSPIPWSPGPRPHPPGPTSPDGDRSETEVSSDSQQCARPDSGTRDWHVGFCPDTEILGGLGTGDGGHRDRGPVGKDRRYTWVSDPDRPDPSLGPPFPTRTGDSGPCSLSGPPGTTRPDPLPTRD